MSFGKIDVGSVLRRLADRKIEEAMQEGKFDNLPGAGKPLDLEPMPPSENARLTWWALRILKQNDVTPDEIRWRKQVDTLRDQLADAQSETQVQSLVNAVNALVGQLNRLGTNAIASGFAKLVLEEEIVRWRNRSGSSTGA